MKNPASNGERFALAEKDLWYKDVAQVLRSNGFDKAPTFAVPVWLAKILAIFSKELKLTIPYLGRLRSVKNTSKAKDILGFWSKENLKQTMSKSFWDNASFLQTKPKYDGRGKRNVLLKYFQDQS